MKRILAFLSLVLAFSVPLMAAKPVKGASRVVEPTQSVGAVTPFSTAADLIKAYGAANVAVSTDTFSCRVFPGKPDELHVEFRNPGQGVARVLIGGQGSAWATATGVRIGTTLEELETINGGPFDVTGINWQVPARVVSWKGGALPPQMSVDLAPAGGEMDAALRKKLTSRRLFLESSNESLKGFVVTGMVLEW